MPPSRTFAPLFPRGAPSCLAAWAVTLLVACGGESAGPEGEVSPGAAISSATGDTSAGAPHGATSPIPDFADRVLPLLDAHCVPCHGPERTKGGLRLDDAAGLEAGGKSGPVVLSRDSASSELMLRVRSDDPFDVMPQEGRGAGPLSPAQVELLAAWIDGGAPGLDLPDPDAPVLSDHWSYAPVRRPEPPAVVAAEWVRDPVDAFVLAGLEQAGLPPSPEADRRTLIRRLHSDLTGLPPSPEDLAALVAADDFESAYAQRVDELLASPHFGERWARHWLDLARYADSDGYERDDTRPDAWRYRDWVIDAINADMPFEQFVREQLAGDLLPDPTEAQLIATGFHRQTLTNREAGVDPEEDRVKQVGDRTDTTGAVFLGTTMGCARCHDHKFDPVSQRDYYRLSAFFDNADEAELELPVAPDDLPAYRAWEQELAAHEAELAAIQERILEYLAPRLPSCSRYTTVTVTSARAVSGASPEPRADGTLVAPSPAPDTAVWELDFSADVDALDGIDLEALPDPDLPGGGPGLAPDGRFVVTGLTLRVSGARGEREVPLTRSDATPDASWGEQQQPGLYHHATWWCDAPLRVYDGDRFELRIEQQAGGGQVVAQLRVSAVTGRDPGERVPDQVRRLRGLPREQLTDAEGLLVREHFISRYPTTRRLYEELEALSQRRPDSPAPRPGVLRERHEDRRTTHLLRRGDFLQPTAAVTPGTPRVLPPLRPRGAVADRLDLARWLTDPGHPLTARVRVNHVWRHLFGAGLVATPGDFGLRGEAPTHPQLLDLLAADFVAQGGRLKPLVRRLVLSATWRQSSARRPDADAIDASNRLLHRQHRGRVEAEIIRDRTLAAAGLLSRRVGGPSVFPPLPEGVAEQSYAFRFSWEESAGDDGLRRGLYTFFKRTAPHPELVGFNAPDAIRTCLRRERSNTPLQALISLNGATAVTAARGLARRCLAETSAGDDDRVIDLAFGHSLQRPPSDAERGGLLELLTAARAHYRDHDDDALALAGASRAGDPPAHELAAWTATLRVVLNLDEFLSRE